MNKLRLAIVTGTVVIALIGASLIDSDNSKDITKKEEVIYHMENDIDNVIESKKKLFELDLVQKKKEVEEKRILAEKRQKQLEKVKVKKKNKTQVASNRNGGNKYRIVTLTVTAYAPFDDKSGINSDGNPNKTATGTRPKKGTVAVNPNRFPYGTKFYIEGYGWGVGEDTGGAMRNNSNKIDIYMDTHDEAMAWGVKTIKVKVYE